MILFEIKLHISAVSLRLFVSFTILLKQLDERAIDAVMNKLFKNYKNWCKFLGRKHCLHLRY
jgi:hypothetical protein